MEEAIGWLTRAFGFQDYYRYGDGPRGGQMWAGKAAIQVNRADRGQRSPAQLGCGTQSLTVFLDDVDAHYARAKAAGAKFSRTRMRPSTANISMRPRIWMDTHWLFSRHAKDRSPEEWGAVVKAQERDGRVALPRLAGYRAGDANDAMLRAGGSSTRIGELNIELF